ncbi:unnamed protein product [Lactuca saligna]|uniref:Uncharacterized protein n=1 Tax=Lactuca saligna TaxID=75948 RepID=A0AA36E7F2_LACSI|nr:unnamed protein product [Lactuca saligna]
MISLSFEPNELYQMACVAFCLIVASFSFFTIYLHSYLFILLSETRSHEEEKQSFYTQDIEGTELKVTAVSVHDMLGIPICGTKLTQLDQCSFCLHVLRVNINGKMQPVSLELYFKKNRYQQHRLMQLCFGLSCQNKKLIHTILRYQLLCWTFSFLGEKIRYREAFEQEKGQFGLGEINEEFVDEQDEGDTDLEDNDYDKDKDHSIEAYE